MKEIEFDPVMRVIPKEFCDSHGCSEYLMNAQALCWIGKCPYEDELD